MRTPKSIEDAEIMKIQIMRVVETAMVFYEALLDYQLNVLEPLYPPKPLKVPKRNARK